MTRNDLATAANNVSTALLRHDAGQALRLARALVVNLERAIDVASIWRAGVIKKGNDA